MTSITSLSKRTKRHHHQSCKLSFSKPEFSPPHSQERLVPNKPVRRYTTKDNPKSYRAPSQTDPTSHNPTGINKGSHSTPSQTLATTFASATRSLSTTPDQTRPDQTRPTAGGRRRVRCVRMYKAYVRSSGRPNRPGFNMEVIHGVLHQGRARSSGRSVQAGLRTCRPASYCLSEGAAKVLWNVRLFEV
jgi:hypothetical protein